LRAVIFDMDGTLFDSSTAVPDAYIATLRDRTGRPLTRADVIERYPLGPPINILRNLIGPEATDDDVLHYHGHLRTAATALTVYDGIPELLTELLGAGMHVGVFTGADTASCTMLVEIAGLGPHFEEHALCGTDLVHAPKPDPSGVLLACERLGVAPADTAYVGDSPLDQQAARSAGCVAVAAGWGHLFDPAEPADFVAHHPRDVLELLT